METKKEMRVYVIDSNRFDYDIENMDIFKWSDEKWMDESEEQGSVYSLKGFQYAINGDELNTFSMYIRFIET